jgi:hypothetical protein
VTIPAARAAGPERTSASESDRLIAQALDLREAGNDREALPLLQQAVSIDPTPRARAQLALGQQGLGSWVDAEQGLVAVLASRRDPWVQKNRALLETALATVQRQLGWLEVEVDVPGATVTLNGAIVGAIPLPGAVRVSAGVISLKVTAPGYAPVARLVQVAAGEHARETLALQREPAVTPPPPIVPANDTVKPAVQPAVLLPPPAADPPERPPPTRGKTLAWATLAASGLSLAGGVVANIVRENDAKGYDQAATNYNAACRTTQCPSVRPSHSDVDVFTGLSVAGYAVGAALGVTAAVLLLRPGADSRQPDSAHASARCGAGALAVWCGGTF